MDFVPVLNFPAHAPVPFKKAMWMVHTLQARLAEKGIELIFPALDAAIASDKGSGHYAASHSVAGKAHIAVSPWDGNDPFQGCSAVMMRATTGRAPSYF